MSGRLRDADLNILSLHACHQCGSIPVFPCSSEAVKGLDPAICITLIDDVYSCRQRLERGGYPYGYHQLLNWRQVECGIADLIADACRIENVYLAAKHPRMMVYRLLFEPKRPRLYSACQITNVRDDPKARKEIEAHRRHIHQQFVVFDPLTVDDRILVNSLPGEEAEAETLQVGIDARWPSDLSDIGSHYEGLVPEDPNLFPLTVQVKEAEELNTPDQMSSPMSTIDAQITQRDFRYIDQADAVAAYRPRKGHESRGVAAEKMYAAGSGGKTVIEYSPWEDIEGTQSRPFATPVAGPVLQDLSNFYRSLEASARQEAERRYARKNAYYTRFEAFRDQFSQ
ncbi:MAG: hypothetical protein AMK72_07915 [Planctomycetes bacterium SM23_25]|nr:MAG: hypothetical protein AMK72_07915 [Planctomycetes bacterium SM23_25]